MESFPDVTALNEQELMGSISAPQLKSSQKPGETVPEESKILPPPPRHQLNFIFLPEKDKTRRPFIYRCDGYLQLSKLGTPMV